VFLVILLWQLYHVLDLHIVQLWELLPLPRRICFRWYLSVCLVAFSALTLLVGLQEVHPACKKYWGDGGGGRWLIWMEWCPARCSLCLPLLISPCTTKSRSSLLPPTHPGSPGKRAIKLLWWWCLFVSNFPQKLPNRFAWNFRGRLAMGHWTGD